MNARGSAVDASMRPRWKPRGMRQRGGSAGSTGPAHRLQYPALGQGLPPPGVRAPDGRPSSSADGRAGSVVRVAGALPDGLQTDKHIRVCLLTFRAISGANDGLWRGERQVQGAKWGGGRSGPSAFQKNLTSNALRITDSETPVMFEL